MRYLFLVVCLCYCTLGFGQSKDQDALFIKQIHDRSLSEAKCYDWLTHLSTKIGGRLAGSKGSELAVQYTKKVMNEMGLDAVTLQECQVKQWHRNGPALVQVRHSEEPINLNALALGNSIGTSEEGLVAEIIEVQSLDEVRELGEAIKGKIVFYNRPMDPTQFRTFNAYGGAVDQRVWGASVAAEYGAVAALVRSLTLKSDDVPHTGTLVYKEEIPQIPGLAISTNDADRLSSLLRVKKSLKVYIRTLCAPGEMIPSHNVIGEIKGSEFPDEIILVGGHLDSWDVGGGAHDDGAGCVHSLQVLQTLIDLKYKPKRTIRCVMFMNEENGLAGAQKYAEVSNENNEYHLAALESDAGGFVPRGFSFDADTSVLKKHYAMVSGWLPLLEPYGLYFTTGGSGADINPLKSQKGVLIGLRPDSQRYFDYHHTAIDLIETVNKRELELGAAAMTSLIYLIDKYGLE